ncbi:tumor necrosis factor alpha-induced protein 2-like [Hoplias malabaricus]|uniref:tumor necrosis factor alpha-induced protein 2-like n=1 Tax=Hoplias malabaricus TaxID=27720 RepID=UPI0034626697
MKDKASSCSKYKFKKIPKITFPFVKKTLHVQPIDIQENIQQGNQHDIQTNIQSDIQFDIQPDIKSAEISLTFKQNLKEQHFAAAGKQLINREERLFSVKENRVGFNRKLVEEEEDDEENLKKDFEDLFEQVWSTVDNSFQVQTEAEIEALRQAVIVIQKEEEQDRRWEGYLEKERPQWRPRCCRDLHDSRLQNMVKQRMEEAKLDSDINLKSSVQKEITSKAKQLKVDLLHVAKYVKQCYPGENVCRQYAKLYHQEFSGMLREIADYGLADEDCLQVLQCVNIFYQRILNGEELAGVIKYEQLEALLPENMLEPLVEQFLTHIETELRTCFEKMLRREEADPELRDGCYFSTLAIDVIQFVNNALKSAHELLGSHTKSQKITSQMKDFLRNYQDFLKKISEYNQKNPDGVLKASLHCIRQLREYIMKEEELFPEHIKSDCVCLIASIREICHGYFTKTILKDLKGKYAPLGTQEWLNSDGNVCKELLECVKTHIQKHMNLEISCREELLSHLHKEVLAEYVKTVMKKKLRLRNEKEQQQAAKALCDNNQEIHNLFMAAGSNLDDLKDILPKLAELLTLKDPHCIELQLITLSRSYPDFSKAHVCAWLYLKADLSSQDLKNISKAFSDFREPSENNYQIQDPLYLCSNFFSKVLVK